MSSRWAALAAVAAAVVAITAPTAAADATVQTYPLPTGTPGTGMVAAPDGTLWFATGDSNQTPRIGRLDPGSAQPGTSNGMVFYNTPTFLDAPCCATFVRSLDYDADANRVWFVRSDGMYGFGTASAMVAGSDAGFSWATAHYPSGPGSTGYVGLWGVAYDPVSKSTWLAENGSWNQQAPAGSGYYPGHRIARTDGGLGLTEYPNIAQQGGETSLVSLRYDAKPRGVSIVKGGRDAWFAESDPGNPGWRIARTNGAGYTEYLLPCEGGSPCSGSFTGTGPTETTVAADGSVWFTNELNNSIGLLDPTGPTFTKYSLGSIDPSLAPGRPMQIRAAVDGTLWVAVYGGYGNPNANAIVRIAPSADSTTATVYKTGTSMPLSIAPSPTGDVWFALNPTSGNGAIGRLAGVVAGGTRPPGDDGGNGGDGGGGGGGGVTTAIPPVTTTMPSPKPVVLTGTTAKPGTVSTSGDTTSVTQICVGPPQDKCSLVYLIQSHEYVTGFPGSKERAVTAAAKKKKKPPLPILAKVSVTLKGGQKKTTKVRLSAKARKALAKERTIKATLIVQQKQKDGSLKTIQKKNVTFKARGNKKAGKKK